MIRSVRVDSQEHCAKDGVIEVKTWFSKEVAKGRGMEGNRELTSAVYKCRLVCVLRG